MTDSLSLHALWCLPEDMTPENLSFLTIFLKLRGGDTIRFFVARELGPEQIAAYAKEKKAHAVILKLSALEDARPLLAAGLAVIEPICLRSDGSLKIGGYQAVVLYDAALLREALHRDHVIHRTSA